MLRSVQNFVFVFVFQNSPNILTQKTRMSESFRNVPEVQTCLKHNFGDCRNLRKTANLGGFPNFENLECLNNCQNIEDSKNPRVLKMLGMSDNSWNF